MDSTGTLIVFLTDTLARKRAATVLHDMMRRTRTRPFEFRPAPYSYSELMGRLVRLVRQAPRGLVSAGVRERENLMLIEVIDEKARRAMLDTARRLGIPDHALRVQLGKPASVGDHSPSAI